MKEGNGLLEESEQQSKRVPRPNQKYQEDYEIGEPSGARKPSSTEPTQTSKETPEEKSNKSKQVPQSKSYGDRGKSAKKNLEGTTSITPCSDLLPDLDTPNGIKMLISFVPLHLISKLLLIGIFYRETLLPKKDNRSKSRTSELQTSFYNNLDSENSNPVSESMNSRSKKKPAEIVL